MYVEEWLWNVKDLFVHMLELTNFAQCKNITNLDFNISISMYKT
jgi:hypothetical protein